jgi:hypothetical protein
VLSQVLDNREKQLVNTVTVLTEDFGFKQVVASLDKPTIDSVLSNHGERINADLMALFSLDATSITSVPELLPGGLKFMYPKLIDEAKLNGNSSSILSLDNKLYQVLFFNVRAPRSIAVALMGFEINQELTQQLKNITQLDTTIIVYINDQESYRISTLSPEQYAQNVLIEDNDSIYWPVLAYSSDDKLISTSFTFLEKQNLKIEIMLSNSVKRVFADFTSLQAEISIIAFFSVLIAIILGALLSRKLVRPIQAFMMKE